jgi:hypothetical protein
VSCHFQLPTEDEGSNKGVSVTSQWKDLFYNFLCIAKPGCHNRCDNGNEEDVHVFADTVRETSFLNEWEGMKENVDSLSIGSLNIDVTKVNDMTNEESSVTSRCSGESGDSPALNPHHHSEIHEFKGPELVASFDVTASLPIQALMPSHPAPSSIGVAESCFSDDMRDSSFHIDILAIPLD